MMVHKQHGGVGPTLDSFMRACLEDRRVIAAFNEFSGLRLPVPITEEVEPMELICFLVYVHKIGWPCVEHLKARGVASRFTADPDASLACDEVGDPSASATSDE